METNFGREVLRFYQAPVFYCIEKIRFLDLRKWIPKEEENNYSISSFLHFRMFNILNHLLCFLRLLIFQTMQNKTQTIIASTGLVFPFFGAFVIPSGLNELLRMP